MTPGRVVGVKMMVRDIEASIEFYTAALGFRWQKDIWSFQFGEYPRDDFFLVSISEPENDDASRPVGGGQFGFVVANVDEAAAYC